jgi:hypothetical protein
VRGPVVSAAEAGRLISEDSNLRMAESNYLPEAMLQVAGFLASFAVIALLFTMMFTPAVRGHATVPPSIERRKFLATLGGAAAFATRTAGQGA